jgi:hypothetical protein
MFGEEIDGTRITRNRAEVSLLRSELGQVDSLGRFTSVVLPRLLDPFGRASRNAKETQIHGLAPIVAVYSLILTDTYWEFGPTGEGPREVKGPPEWRLEYFEHECWVVKDVATRYLTKLRDESSSEAIKGNSEKSIATLVRAK